MSERNTAARNASIYRSSGSPQQSQRSAAPTHPDATPQANDGPPQEHEALSYYGRGQRSHEPPPAGPSVQNILNPATEVALTPEEAFGGYDRVLIRARKTRAGDVSQTETQNAPVQSYYHDQSENAPYAGPSISPMGPRIGQGPSATTSPTTSHNDATVQQPAQGRRILSPRGPRASSIYFGGPPREQEYRGQNRISSASPAKRPYEPEVSDEYRPHPNTQPSSLPHTPNIPGASISRSFSQPIAQPPGGAHPPPPPLPLPPPDIQGRGPVSPVHRLQQSPRAMSGRSFSTSVAHGEQRSPWADPARRPSIGATLMSGEGQALMMLPGSDTPIAVPVDNTQASKKANEKRGKNAEASTRHRKKKKEEREELEAEREAMRVQLAEQSALIEHHRAQHYRFREIVRSTPSIAHHAEGQPPSPPLSRPQVAVPRPQHHSVRSHSSEASSAERPAQRPRLEEHGTPTIHTYVGTPAGTPGQTPLQSPVYGGVPPRPESASSSAGGGLDRLPPLRSLESLGSQNLTQGPPQEQDPRTGQWAPIQPRQYETGWATGLRRSGEGPQR